MSKLPPLLASIVALSLPACGESICRCLPDDVDAGTSDERDAATCTRPPPPLELPACGERLTRTGESIGREGVVSGPATVTALSVDADGSARLTVRQDGGATRTLTLPAAPDVTEGEEVAVDVDGTGLAIRRAGTFLAYEGGLVDDGAHLEELRDASEVGRAPIVLGDVEGELEVLCASVHAHHSPSFCPDVGLLSFGLRLGETVVAPGDRAELTFDGRDLVVLNRNITRRDDRYAVSCDACGDYWFPSLDVAIVARATP